MRVQSFFDLDCNPVIPECGFQCDTCVQEIQSVFGGMEGVFGVSRETRGDTDGIVVDYDSDVIGIDDLMNTFRSLPSFYEGKFVPSLLDG